MSSDKKGREMLELSRDCALPEPWRERKRTDKRFAMLAAALGKSISGPPESLLCPRDRTVLQPVPTEAPGPITAKPVCPVLSLNKYPKARKEEEAPAVVGLADLEIE